MFKNSKTIVMGIIGSLMAYIITLQDIKILILLIFIIVLEMHFKN